MYSYEPQSIHIGTQLFSLSDFFPSDVQLECSNKQNYACLRQFIDL